MSKRVENNEKYIAEKMKEFENLLINVLVSLDYHKDVLSETTNKDKIEQTKNLMEYSIKEVKRLQKEMQEFRDEYAEYFI